MTPSLSGSEPVVWIVETGEYEQRMIWGVYASIAAGVAAIKETYGEPYIVRWIDPDPSVEEVALVGHFEAVRGKSTKHIATYDFERWDVVT